jgi:hypothetical protein
VPVLEKNVPHESATDILQGHSVVLMRVPGICGKRRMPVLHLAPQPAFDTDLEEAIEILLDTISCTPLMLSTMFIKCNSLNCETE